MARGAPLPAGSGSRGMRRSACIALALATGPALPGAALYTATPFPAAAAEPDRAGRPGDALRSALLLRDTVPALRSRAEALVSALNAVATLRTELTERRDAVTAARDALAARHAEIAGLVERREEMQRETDTERLEVARQL